MKGIDIISTNKSKVIMEAGALSLYVAGSGLASKSREGNLSKQLLN